MIRLLSNNDTKNYRDLRLLTLETDPTSFLSSYDFEKKYPLQYFINKVKYATQTPIFGYYGFFENKKLLAYAQIFKSNLVKKQHIAHIYEVCVHPNHRRKNIATKLVKHIIEKTRKTSVIEQIHLWVNSDNHQAIALYEKLGFARIAKIPKGVKDAGNKYQDELLYCLNLK